MKHSLSIILIACSAALSLRAQTFITPDFRYDVDTVYSEWDSFTSAFAGPNSPDVEGTIGSITQTTPGAVVASSGNIYNPAGALDITLDVSLSLDAETVIFQTRTLGTPVDPSSALLSYGPEGSETVVSASILQAATGGAGFGAFALYAYSWDLSGLGITDFDISFNSVGAHTSLDQATLDVGPSTFSVIPEPSAFGLLGGLSALGLIAVRRRR